MSGNTGGHSDAFPVSVSSLHFPSAAQSVSQTLSSLRRSALSISNRLRSIESDAAFVAEVAEHYGLPLVANERCGSWYISPDIKAGSAYFKSTDGHTGAVMPDALSKTVPIWCAVMNRALFPSDAAYHAVQLPPNYLGASEESQIEHRIDGFVKSLKDLKLDLDDLRQQLRKPIRVAWANRSYFHPTDLQKEPDYNLFVLCSASKRVHGAEISEGGYIQGAGDDSEGWAQGLTPPVFWANKATLLKTPEEALPELIEELVKEHRGQDTGEQATLVVPTRNLYISQTNVRLNDSGLYDLVIDCNARPEASEGDPKRLNLGCRSSKLGSRDLRQELDKVRAFVSSQLASDPSQSLLVTCETGKDLSAGALLAIVCLFYNDDGAFTTSPAKRSIDKQFIRQRLAWIVSSKHDVNPSRPTLQSVNAFLMERPDY
ncbi:initiator tRNA phosphoribosyl transferase family protein [Aspergillus thermomutatus]|uniref:tRNA a64-2'-o-ribosylphosphate transferase n=1 Tax=Aspergillus thermomutatus TaxID=41047 RepID=A0A397HQL2_ASPTH|nr:uncharacterized protein CDV56_101110 [Aspergillus thermomutatus]RHZ63876.1 hypothetical protein CDV56_101110 [Aspergillus thermomutatus]